MRTEHALDWSKTAQEIEDEYEQMAIERDELRYLLTMARAERDRYRKELEESYTPRKVGTQSEPGNHLEVEETEQGNLPNIVTPKRSEA